MKLLLKSAFFMLTLLGILNPGWYSMDWNYRTKIYDFKPFYQEYVSNFAMLIYLSNNSGLSNYAKADGSDIVFCDNTGTNQLAHEKEYYSNGNLYAWVKVDVDTNTNQNYIYIYYGNNGTNISNNNSVLWSDFHIVSHLSESYKFSEWNIRLHCWSGTR